MLREGEKMNNITGKPRLFYIDNIRSFVIILVVIAHVCITYSGVGGWYYIENDYDEINYIYLIIFGLIIGFLASWAMSLMFFIAGYFVPKTYDNKGFLKFITAKLIRLGIPFLI